VLLIERPRLQKIGRRFSSAATFTVFKASFGSNAFSGNEERYFRKGPLQVPFPMCPSRLRSQRPKDHMPL
jgi:hypothetical protein